MRKILLLCLWCAPAFAQCSLTVLAGSTPILSGGAPADLNNNFANLANCKLTWRGSWSSATSYAQSDVVSFSGATYIALQGTNLNQNPATQSGYWALMNAAPAWGSVIGTLSAQSDLAAALGAKEPTIAAGTTSQFWRGDKSWQTLNAAAVANAVDQTGSYANPAWITSLAFSKITSVPAFARLDQSNTFSAGLHDFSAATGLKLPIASGYSPNAAGLIGYDSSTNTYRGFNGSALKTFATTDQLTGGTVTSITLATPAWLTGGSTITGTGTWTIAAASGQSAHQVIGTCGSATSFAPCTLVIGDLPAGYLYSNLSGAPAIPTIASTSAVLKGNGSGNAIAATSGTDYAPATSGSGLLKGNGAGGFSAALIGDVPTGYPWANLTGVPTTFYQVLGNNGATQTARNRLNVIPGANIVLTFADNPGTSSTDVTIAATGSGLGTVTTTGSPASGNLAKFSGATSVTNADLSGDVTTGGSLVATVGKVNGGAIPVSTGLLGSNSSSQLIAATLASANIYVGNASNVPSPVSMSGDGTMANTGALTVTKTGGVSFAPSATTDATNATNISSGTLAAARGGAGTINGLLEANGAGVVRQATVGDLPTNYPYTSLSGAPTLEYQLVGVGGTSQTARGRLNIIAGSNVTVTPADNSGTGSTDVTIASTGGGGSLAVQANGSAVGTPSTLNYVAGTGIVNSLTLSGSTVSVQQGIDTALVQTIPGEQSGAARLCASASASGTTYLCALSTTLGAYTTGMVVPWKPDVNGTGGATTINIDTLGAKSIKEADGATNPTSSDIVAGRLYLLWYDGAAFRLGQLGPTGAAGSNGATGPSGPTGAAGPTGGGGASLLRSHDFVLGGFNNAGAGFYPVVNLQGGVGVGGDANGGSGFSYVSANIGPSSTTPLLWQFRWDINWDNTQAVKVLVTTADGGAPSGNFKIDFSMACIASGTAINSPPTYGSVLSTGSYSSANTTHEFTLTPLDISTTSCAPNEYAILRAARDISVGSNSTDNLSIFSLTLTYSVM